MTSADDGCQAYSLSLMRDLVAASATFQQLVGAENAAQAKSRIVYGGRDDETEPPEGMNAIVRVSPDYEIEGTGSTGLSIEELGIEVEFETRIPGSVPDVYSRMYYWWNKYDGLILKDMLQELTDNPGSYCDVVSVDNAFPAEIGTWSEQNGVWVGKSMRVWRCAGAAVEASV